MKHIHGLASTAQALRHIFLPTLELTRTPFLRYEVIRAQRQLRFVQYSRARSPTTSAAAQAAQGVIRDEDIRSQLVHVVNEDGALDPPSRTMDVLRSLNRAEYFLLQVSPGTVERPPVCKIVSKKALREQERAKAKAAHSTKTAIKQIELNWAIDAHDLSHRLKQLTSFLEKGRRVEIILTRKKGKRHPTGDEVKNLMDSVLETIKEADAAQVKPMEGEPGKHVLLVVKKKDA